MGAVAINAQLRGYVLILCSFKIRGFSSFRLNVHLSSIVASKPFQMPVEVVARKTESSLDAYDSRLSSFGYSGTIAHGAFRASRYARMTSQTAEHSL